jgi:hypothetical protein
VPFTFNLTCLQYSTQRPLLLVVCGVRTLAGRSVINADLARFGASCCRKGKEGGSTELYEDEGEAAAGGLQTARVGDDWQEGRDGQAAQTVRQGLDSKAELIVVI